GGRPAVRHRRGVPRAGGLQEGDAAVHRGLRSRLDLPRRLRPHQGNEEAARLKPGGFRMKRRQDRVRRAASARYGRGVLLLRAPREVDRRRAGRSLPSGGPGFLTLERFLARNVYRDGGTSPWYRTEVLHRRGVDAVAILPFYVDPKTRRLMVVCKIGFRP